MSHVRLPHVDNDTDDDTKLLLLILSDTVDFLVFNVSGDEQPLKNCACVGSNVLFDDSKMMIVAKNALKDTLKRVVSCD